MIRVAASLLLIVVPGPSTGFQPLGDPFVVGKKGSLVRFQPPIGQETHLLTCENMHLYGTATSSNIPGDRQPKFDQFRIAIGDKDQMSIGVLGNANISSPPTPTAVLEIEESPPPDIADQHALSILRVIVDGLLMNMTGAVAAGNDPSTDDISLVLVWRKENDIGEVAQFTHGDTVIQVKSAVSKKRTAQNETILFNHLDLRLLELALNRCTAGVLAEVWGVAPMSSDTAKMLQSANSSRTILA